MIRAALAVVAVLVLAAVLGPVPVLAVTPAARAETPADTLRGFFGAVSRVVTDPSTEEQPLRRLLLVRRLVHEVFDFRAAAELALGPEWRARTPAEQEAFVKLFADLVEGAYILRVATKASVTGGVRVTVLDETVDGDHATVRTTVASRAGDELGLDYRMERRAGRWRVRDVAIDGIGLAANYRAQFRRVMQASSYTGLVEQMKAQVADSLLVAVAAAAGEPSTAAAPVREAAPPVGQVLAAEGSAERAIVREIPREALADMVAVTRVKVSGPPAAGEAAVSATAVPTPSPAAVASALRAAVAPAPPGGVVPTPPPATSAVVRPAAEAPASAYWIQVGAFRNLAAAHRLADRLRAPNLVLAEGPAATVATRHGDRLVRVRIGPFPDRAAALSALRDLQARGLKPFLLAARD